MFIDQENVTLIKEINDLRRELKLTRSQVHDLESTMGTNRSKPLVGSKSTQKRVDTAGTGKQAIIDFAASNEAFISKLR